MSKQGETVTKDSNQTQTATLPAHITQAQIDMLAKAFGLSDPFTSNAPNFGVMGLMPDQMMASNLAQAAARYLSTTPRIPAYDVFGMGNDWNSDPVALEKALAEKMQAAQLGPEEYKPFLNPYIDDVIDPTLKRLQQQQGEVTSKIGADAAAAHMYGGSREAVMKMLADRNYRDTVAQTVGNLKMQGFDKASNLAVGNADKRQQANVVNAQLGNTINALNAQLQSQGALQAQNLQFQGAQNDASRFLQAIGLQSQQDTAAYNNTINIANLLSNLGGQQRAIGQQAIDLPFTRLKELIAAVNGMQAPTSTTTTGSTTSSSEKPIDWASILTGGLGLLTKFSDRRLKENIKRVGKLDNGLPVYSFNYIGEPATIIGLMSDDVRKVRPEAVHEFAGYDTVDYGLATSDVAA